MEKNNSISKARGDGNDIHFPGQNSHIMEISSSVYEIHSRSVPIEIDNEDAPWTHLELNNLSGLSFQGELFK